MTGTHLPRALFILACACASLSACNLTAAPPQDAQPASAAAVAAAPAIDDAARTEAKEIFATRCTPCHGAGGMGDGPASAGLTPKPRNFTDAAWQAKVTDQHIETIIQYGGAAVGKSAAMPPNPDLTARQATVMALREHIRSLKR